MMEKEDLRGKFERKEQRWAFSEKVEVIYHCRKCMSVAVGDPPRCLYCERKHAPKPSPEEDQAMSEQMEAIVKEYNALTGKSVKRFASIAIGVNRLEKARFDAENPKVNGDISHEKMSEAVSKSWTDEEIANRRGQRHTITVKETGKTYNSFSKALRDMDIKIKGMIAFRLRLKNTGSASLDHNGKTYHFTAELRAKDE